MKYGFRGFTLAEVLITLGIIGVVAALTIPVLMNNYQKSEYVTKLKKFYSQFNQASTLLTQDYNCSNNLKCTGLFEYISEETPEEERDASESERIYKIAKEFAKKFKLARDCSSEETIENCQGIVSSEWYDGSNPEDYTSDYHFITADGTSVLIDPSGDCHYDEDIKMEHCGSVQVDVNGAKGPNFWGRDIFAFHLVNGKGIHLLPFGSTQNEHAEGWWSDEDNGCVSQTKAGTNCAGRVMGEGWQMNY